MTDLHRYLAAESASVWSIDSPVSLQHELTALQHELDRAGKHPIVLARNVRNLLGEPSSIPVVTNLSASRTLTAQIGRAHV